MTPLIDSHVHIWDPEVNRYDWLEGVLNRAYLPAEYHASSPSTTGVVFVEAGAVDGLAEARWVASFDWPELLGIVATAPLERGAGVAGYLEEVQSISKVVGIRRLLQDEPLAFFESPELRAGLVALQATGLPFDACIRHHQLPALTTLLAGLPDLQVVLDHIAKPPVATGDDGTWERNLRALAALPQVRVKLSGVPPEVAPDAPVRAQAAPWLAATLDAFGAERCMVASDWPVSAVTPHALSAGDWLTEVLADLRGSAAEQQQLAAGTATEFYNLAALS